jgi:hypothetical protein
MPILLQALQLLIERLMLAQPISITCPYCGETIEIMADPSVVRQEYVEDCQVCCRPIILTITSQNDGFPRVEARTEDE